MRRLVMTVGAITALTLAGCGTEPAATSQPGAGTQTANTVATPAPPAVTTPAAVDHPQIRAEFDKAAKATAWFSKVTTVQLDGQAVIVRTTLAKTAKTDALAACEAAYKAAKTAAVDFVSVGVRSDSDSTIANRNDLRKHTACQN